MKWRCVLFGHDWGPSKHPVDAGNWRCRRCGERFVFTARLK